MKHKEKVGNPEIKGFTTFGFEHGGLMRLVYQGGSGRGVILMHEVPGLYPLVIAFGRRLVREGFRVYMPSLVGKSLEKVVPVT